MSFSFLLLIIPAPTPSLADAANLKAFCGLVILFPLFSHVELVHTSDEFSVEGAVDACKGFIPNPDKTHNAINTFLDKFDVKNLSEPNLILEGWGGI